MRIEMVACLNGDDIDAEWALRAYTEPDFRMRVSSQIARIWPEDGNSCVETKGVTALLSPTIACNHITEFLTSDVASQHSQVVSKPIDDDYQTVYFKESVKTFVVMDGVLALHYVNFTRSVKLGRVKRWAGTGKIKESEQRAAAELQAVIDARGTS